MNTKPIALVTGGARGIGSAISRRLVEDGFQLIIVDVDEVAGRLEEQNIGPQFATFYRCDISSEEQVTGLFDWIVERYARLDVLVNNAAIIRDNVVHKMSVEDFDSVIAINLKGAWLMCRSAAILMRSQGSGRIINISSRGWLGNFGQTNYAASKAGLIGLTRVLALELGKYNVLVNAVAPGLIDTPLVQGLPPEARESLIKAQPTKSMGQPEDVAHLVAFLAEKRTQFITGQTLYVDGGKSIGAGN